MNQLEVASTARRLANGSDGAHARRGIIAMVAIALLLLITPCAADERTPAEGKVVRLTLPLDIGQTTGTIVRYSTITFTLQTESGDEHRILWNAIPADKVDRYWRYLEEPQGDAKRLFELGDLLIRHRDGEPLAERAFEQALRLDPTLHEAVER
ncbi:MAG: hypothetical protein ACPGYV_12465, partial [Phycisphaeraceae bacterium]